MVAEQGFFIDDELLYDDIPAYNSAFAGETDSLSSWGSDEWDKSDEDESGADSDVHSYYEDTPQGTGVNRQASARSTPGRSRKFESTEHRDEDGVLRLLDFRKAPNDKQEDDKEEESPYIDVAICDSRHPPPELPPEPEGLSKEDILRRHIVQSIIDSENSYVRTLKKLINDYQVPLENSSQILEREKVDTIFKQVRAIHQCHGIFQIALAARVKEWDTVQCLGDVFVASFSKSMVLAAYSVYVNNFTTAMETMKKACASKPSFEEFLKERQSKNEDRLDLQGMMLKPIQRFPQFICLLQDLLKHTPQGHQDRMSLQLALTRLETLAGRLNERKRQAEQRHEVRQVLKNLNVKFSTKATTSTNRCLIRQDDMLQINYNSSGEEAKINERRIFMLTDLVICALVVHKSTFAGSYDPSGPKYKLKWSVPLRDVDVLEPLDSAIYSSEKNAGKSTLSLGHGNKGTLTGKGTGKLYAEREDLLNDLAIAEKFGAEVKLLKRTYKTFNSASVDTWINYIHTLIARKDEEIRAADSCKIQLSLPATGKSGTTIVTLKAKHHKDKTNWIADLEMAKLALQSRNNPAWYDPDEEGKLDITSLPLMMTSLPVAVTSPKQSMKGLLDALMKTQLVVQAAVYCPLEFSDMSPKQHLKITKAGLYEGSIWVSSGEQKRSILSIVSFHPPTPHVVESFPAGEALVSCIEYVPGVSKLAKTRKQSESDFCLPEATMWVGTETGRITVFNCEDQERKCVFTFKVSPSAVTSLKFLSNRMFVGLHDGTLVVFKRMKDGVWLLEEPHVSLLTTAPVLSLLPVAGCMWCASGNGVFILNANTVQRQASFVVHNDRRVCVQFMVRAGVGVWVSMKNKATIRLFHTETQQYLQEINIAAPIGRMFQGLESRTKSFFHARHVSVTSMLACQGSLWVGTSVGALLDLPIPQLEGVPLINGPARVAYHTHVGPVKFLVATQRKKLPGWQFVRPDLLRSEDLDTFSLTSEEGIDITQDTSTAATVAMATKPQNYMAFTFADEEDSTYQQTAEEDDQKDSVFLESGESDSLNLPKSPRKSKQRDTVGPPMLVVSGGEGHWYLKGDDKERKNKEPMLITWQVA
ncbi:rho guanine nucleotide exchange factor 10-like isoform X2 [Ptychodera flava]|uniref:rho guanine nucleotide exchange factor 10-like isoform X2 n=1 Tax=Ptychodera flava TaxID=63121 RepID=UPI00396A0097